MAEALAIGALCARMAKAMAMTEAFAIGAPCMSMQVMIDLDISRSPVRKRGSIDELLLWPMVCTRRLGWLSSGNVGCSIVWLVWAMSMRVMKEMLLYRYADVMHRTAVLIVVVFTGQIWRKFVQFRMSLRVID